MDFQIKCTGTTEGFEHYYGEILRDGIVITEYYYHPSPNSSYGAGTYRTRRSFDEGPVVAKTMEKLLERVAEALEIEETLNEML